MAEASRQPLLADQTTEPDEASPSKSDVPSWTEEFIQIIKLCGPAVVQLCFQQAMIVTNQVMAGHLGKDELAAVAISLTYFNLMWYFLLGVSSALDTLASQAFGAEDRSGVMCWAVAAASVESILAIPMAGALYAGDRVALIFFQQPPHISVMIATYCRGMLPGLWTFIWSMTIMKALQAQNIMWIPALVTMFTFFCNIGLNYLLIALYQFEGAAFAQSAARILQLLLLAGVIAVLIPGCISFHREAWMALPDEEERKDEPSRDVSVREEIAEAFDHENDGDSNDVIRTASSASTPQKPSAASPRPSQASEGDDDEQPPFSLATLGAVVRDGLSLRTQWEFLKLGLPGGLMMAAEASSFDITTALAGILGTISVDAHTSLLTLCEFTFVTVPFGIATATTIRVGNMLGANKPGAAQRAGQLAIALCMTFSVIMASLIYGFRSNLGYIFVNDEQVVSLVQQVAWLAAFYQFPDCFFGVISGILRGIGRQAQLLAINLFGFWAVGMALGWYLTFPRHFGIEGLWFGLNTGLCTSSVICVVVLLMVDWNKEAAIAQEKVKAVMLENEGLVAIDEVNDEEAPGTGRTHGSTPPFTLQRPSMRRSVSIPIDMSPPVLDRPSMHESHARRYGPQSLDRSSMSAALTGSYIASMRRFDPVTQAFR